MGTLYKEILFLFFIKSGAHGYFEVTHDITRYSKAKIFEHIGKRTPLFTRFSTVGGESGSADTARDPRGFAVKFYTEEGNWDLVGNNTPIFFIRDPMLVCCDQNVILSISWIALINELSTL